MSELQECGIELSQTLVWTAKKDTNKDKKALLSIVQSKPLKQLQTIQLFEMNKTSVKLNLVNFWRKPLEDTLKIDPTLQDCPYVQYTLKIDPP